jgi:hypothetical protein
MIDLADPLSQAALRARRQQIPNEIYDNPVYHQYQAHISRPFKKTNTEPAAHRKSDRRPRLPLHGQTS